MPNWREELPVGSSEGRMSTQGLKTTGSRVRKTWVQVLTLIWDRLASITELPCHVCVTRACSVDKESCLSLLRL